MVSSDAFSHQQTVLLLVSQTAIYNESVCKTICKNPDFFL